MVKNMNAFDDDDMRVEEECRLRGRIKGHKNKNQFIPIWIVRTNGGRKVLDLV